MPGLLSISEEIRNKLLEMNLYPIKDGYPINNNDLSNVIDSISTIIESVMPFKGFDLKNSIFNTLINSEDKTPLVKISTLMLSKQLALNETSNLIQENMPTFDINNLFDKDSSTSFITRHKDMKITQNDNKNNFEKILGYTSYGNNYINKNVLKINTYKDQKQSEYNRETNKNLIENTGKGQLSIMLNLLAKNKYKPIDEIYNEKANDLKITDYFSEDNYSYNYNTTGSTDILFSSLLGKTEILYNIDNNINLSDNGYLSDNDPIQNDDINDKIVWGRDGFETDNYKNYLRGTHNQLDQNINISDKTTFDLLYNVKKEGILSKTRELVKEGKIQNLTHKAFNVNGNVSLNGAGIWQSNNSSYAKSMGNNDSTGVRQHNVIDQYDNFAKTIRFNGNKVYGGSENSVIYNSVLPQIHPIYNIKEKKFDTKKIMFSIENLAYNINSEGQVVNSSTSLDIPKSEIGPNKGRIMWFPPYGIDINETATAKYEPTVMIGRNEPMYNFIHSERSATISFMLLMDYPPQLKNYMYSSTAQKDISEFFLFGGDKINKQINTDNIDKQLDDINLQLKSFESKTQQQIMSNLPKIPEAINIYYPNAIPGINDVDDAINIIYGDTYEVDNGFYSEKYNNFGGLNSLIYYHNKFDDEINENNYQYINPTAHTNQYIETSPKSNLDQMLFDLFNFENSENIVKIKLTSSASKLNPLGNKDLCDRRNQAAKIFILNRLVKMFNNKTFDENKLFIYSNLSDTKSGNNGSDIANTYSDEVKQERYTKIEFIYNITTDQIEKNISGNVKNEYNELLDQKQKLETIRAQLDLNDSSTTFNDRTLTTDAILKGFNSIKDNYYYPGFHSQTPEDFHRRLTFLQQCTRQGGSLSNDTNGNIISYNSVFGRQPICILRIGDFFYSKIIIESINFDYNEATWDMNPEGFGLQPMIAKITLNVKVIGGQSLKGPINALQNALSFNYYANSTFTDEGVYKYAKDAENGEYGEKNNNTKIN